MAIYILEDDVYQAKYLSDLLKNIISFNYPSHRFIDINIFHKPSKLLEFLSSTGESFNLFFLDLKIKKDESSGFVTGKKIREMEDDSLICFVTSYANLALSSYDYGINGHAYIVKDSPEEKIEAQLIRCLESYFDKTNSVSEDKFIFETKNMKISCPFNELLFITPISPHKLLIKTKNKDIYASGSLKDFNQNDDRLVRCHQSFIVNIANIKFIDKSKKEAFIDHENLIPISRKKQKELMLAIERYEKNED